MNVVLPFGASEKSPKVFTHPDKSVDIALVPLTIDINQMQISAFPSVLIAARQTYKDLKVREGDEMFFLGMFTPFYGSKENIPIYRFGRLSMMTEEKIPFGGGDAQDLLLMETPVFGGNSGSPCFFYFDERRCPGNAKYWLAGVVKGYFRDWSEVQFVNTALKPISSDNVGISAVTPSYYIQDILDCDELKKPREAAEELFLAQTKLKASAPVTQAPEKH